MIESKEKRESKKYILIINFRRHFDWLAGYNMNWAVMAQRGMGGGGRGGGWKTLVTYDFHRADLSTCKVIFIWSLTTYDMLQPV